ncbi:MAG: hypothetical protein AAFQ52_07635, partial [Chloroflexota bacterium]
PVYEIVDLYDEGGNVIGTHRVPVYDTIVREEIVQPAIDHMYKRLHTKPTAQDFASAMRAANMDPSEYGAYISSEDGTLGLRDVEALWMLMPALQWCVEQIEMLQTGC